MAETYLAIHIKFVPFNHCTQTRSLILCVPLVSIHPHRIATQTTEPSLSDRNTLQRIFLLVMITEEAIQKTNRFMRGGIAFWCLAIRHSCRFTNWATIFLTQPLLYATNVIEMSTIQLPHLILSLIFLLYSERYNVSTVRTKKCFQEVTKRLSIKLLEINLTDGALPFQFCADKR